MLGLPWWLGGKDPPANAGGMSSIPDPGGSHMLRSTTCNATTEPVLWSLGAMATDRTRCNYESSSARAAHALQQEKPLQ